MKQNILLIGDIILSPKDKIKESHIDVEKRPEIIYDESSCGQHINCKSCYITCMGFDNEGDLTIGKPILNHVDQQADRPRVIYL